MNIRKTIRISITRKNNFFLCPSNREVTFILGTSSATSNPHIYNLEKKGNLWYVPVEIVRKRRVVLERRLKDLKEKLDIIIQVLK